MSQIALASMITLLGMLLLSGQAIGQNTRTGMKSVAFYAPAPEYKRSWPEGFGVVLLHVDIKTGLVTSTEMQRSTGHKILDESAMRGFSRWRFSVPVAPKVTVPITFNHSRPQNYRSSVISGY
jgi:TonB family protein